MVLYLCFPQDSQALKRDPFLSCHHFLQVQIESGIRLNFSVSQLQSIQYWLFSILSILTRLHLLSFSFLSTPSEEVKKAGAKALDPQNQMRFLRDIYACATARGIELTGHWRHAIIHLINEDPFMCRGGTRSICITAKGDVFPCQRIIWDPNSRLASVKQGFLKEINLGNCKALAT